MVVQVGTRLTYAYDRAAVASHMTGWLDAEQVNRGVRLPEFAPASATRRHVGEDLSVLCNVSAEQRYAVTSSTGPDGRPVITVTVGAVTVDVHTTPPCGPTSPPGARPPPSPGCSRTPATPSSPSWQSGPAPKRRAARMCARSPARPAVHSGTLVSLRQEMLSDSRLSLAMPMMAAGGGVWITRGVRRRPAPILSTGTAAVGW